MTERSVKRINSLINSHFPKEMNVILTIPSLNNALQQVNDMIIKGNNPNPTVINAIIDVLKSRSLSWTACSNLNWIQFFLLL